MNNREIKFRVWDKSYKQFLNENCLYIKCNGKSFCGEPGLTGYTTNLYSIQNSDSYVVQQFTGLYDKNGKEIYEGDILEYNKFLGFKNDSSVFSASYSQVIFNNGSFCADKIIYGVIGSGNLSNSCCHFWRFKITGNIFENPELLEKQ